MNVIHLNTPSAEKFMNADIMRQKTELIEKLEQYRITVDKLSKLCAAHQEVDTLQINSDMSGPLFMLLDCLNWAALNLCACRGYGVEGKLKEALAYFEQCRERGLVEGR